MMRHACFVFALISMMNLPAKAECDLAGAMQIYQSPLPEDEDIRRDSKVTQRSEGAVWSIYNDKSGKPLRLIHTDYGESGRDEHILTIGDAKNYIITVHNYYYLAPLSYEGSNLYREEVNHYLFCAAALDLPKEWEDFPDSYVPNARKAADFIFKSEEIQAELKRSSVTPPIWQ